MSKKSRKKRSPINNQVGVRKTKSILFDLLKPIALAIVAAIASLIAYVLTPLNEIVNSLIWEEKAEILLVSQNSSVAQGELLNLDIFVQPTSPVPISGGTLVVDFPKNLLRPSAETQNSLVISVPKLTNSKKINIEPLVFIAQDIGQGKITVSIATKTGVNFKQQLPIEIEPSKEQLYPTRRNFSGLWNIDIGNIHGNMELKEVARTITGEYHLSDGNHGQIEGTRDGKTFRVTFYRGASPSRFFIEGVFEPNLNSDLEIQGSAKLLIPDLNEPTGWKMKQKISFNAIARAR